MRVLLLNMIRYMLNFLFHDRGACLPTITLVIKSGFPIGPIALPVPRDRPTLTEASLPSVHSGAPRLIWGDLTSVRRVCLEKILHAFPVSVSSGWWLEKEQLTLVPSAGLCTTVVWASWGEVGDTLPCREGTMQQGKCQGIPTYSATTNIQNRCACAHQTEAEGLQYGGCGAFMAVR